MCTLLKKIKLREDIEPKDECYCECIWLSHENEDLIKCILK
jgi:transposase